MIFVRFPGRRLIVGTIRRIQFKVKYPTVMIDYGCEFFFPEKIKFGGYNYIGVDCYFHGGGGIEVGRGTCIAARVVCLSENHRWDDKNLEAIPFDHVIIRKKTIIGENVWVGHSAMIMPGVVIGEGAVISAGSVVTKDVPPLAMVGGSPAEIIRYRDEQRYWELKHEDKVWRSINNNQIE